MKKIYIKSSDFRFKCKLYKGAVADGLSLQAPTKELIKTIWLAPKPELSFFKYTMQSAEAEAVFISKEKKLFQDNDIENLELEITEWGSAHILKMSIMEFKIYTILEVKRK